MDDESLGCGGLLAKYPEESTVVTVAASGPERAEEHREAMRHLGVSDYRALGLTDGRLAEDMPNLVSLFDAIMSDIQPQEVYLPYPSLHQDHIATYEAGMRSCRISMSRGHWVPNTVLIYDIAVYDINLYPTDLRWNVFETLTEGQADAKAAACGAYVSEIPSEDHPMTSVKELAAAVGHIRLVPFAEQYALVRQVRP